MDTGLRAEETDRLGYEKKQGKAQKIFRTTSKLKICHHDCADPKSLFFKKGTEI